MPSDVLELPMKILSGNILMRKHWAVRNKEKKMWALMIRNQMRLRKIRLAKDKEHFTLMIISYRKRLCDIDNIWSGVKHLVDAMCDERLIYDDDPKHLKLKVEQYKAKENHTMIIRKY